MKVWNVKFERIKKYCRLFVQGTVVFALEAAGQRKGAAERILSVYNSLSFDIKMLENILKRVSEGKDFSLKSLREKL